MLLIEIDKVSFRCNIDPDAEWVDQVELNGVMVNPEDWFNGFVLRQLDDSVREYLKERRENHE